jgi:uncharacterized protein (TIGR02284 family)
MEEPMERDLSTVATAHTRSVDALQGFRKMMEKAEPEFVSVAQDFANLHATHASRLEKILRQAGEDPDTDGSFMGKVHETVVSARALCDEIDRDVMDQVESGETWILQAFDDAIVDGNAAAYTQDLREMRGELSALLARHGTRD